VSATSSARNNGLCAFAYGVALSTTTLTQSVSHAVSKDQAHCIVDEIEANKNTERQHICESINVALAADTPHQHQRYYVM